MFCGCRKRLITLCVCDCRSRYFDAAKEVNINLYVVFACVTCKFDSGYELNRRLIREADYS